MGEIEESASSFDSGPGPARPRPRAWTAREMAARQLPHTVWDEAVPPILAFYNYAEVV